MVFGVEAFSVFSQCVQRSLMKDTVIILKIYENVDSATKPREFTKNLHRVEKFHLCLYT